MRIALISDTHFGSGTHCGHPTILKTSENIEFGLNSRLLDFYNSTKFVVDQCRILGITTLIHGGDFFKNKNPTSVERYVFSLVLEDLKRNNIRMYAISGNHDFGTGLLPVSSPENILSNSMDCFSTYTTVAFDAGSLVIHFVPWGSEIPKTVSSKTRNVLIGHCTVEGASLGYFDYLIKDAPVSLELLQPFDLSFLGHIHKPQQLSYKDYYIGSVDRVDFAEKDDVKRFLILDTETLGVESIPIPVRPMFEFEFNFVENKSLNTLPEVPEGALVKFKITYDLESKKRTTALLEAIQPLGYFFTLKLQKTVKIDQQPQGFDYLNLLNKYIDLNVTNVILNEQVKKKSLNTLAKVQAEEA